jgi:hypothetical protein
MKKDRAIRILVGIVMVLFLALVLWFAGRSTETQKNPVMQEIIRPVGR